MLTNTAQLIEPFYAMEILARARRLEAEGESVIHMEIGEPDFATPEPVVKAGQAALANGYTHYTPAAGLPELRQSIADYYQQRFTVDLSAERILITPGSSGALSLLMSALIEPGNGVMLPDPGYPCNRHLVRMQGGEVIPVPVRPESGFRLNTADLDAHWHENTKLLMVASPSNPTGQVMSADELSSLYTWTQQRGIALIVDEIYQGLTYAADEHTALSLGETGLYVVNSFSKYFGMTGWRVGWLIAPEEEVQVMDRLAQNTYLAAPTISQHAALAAFLPACQAILERRTVIFRQRRDYLYDALCGLGFNRAVDQGTGSKPKGAFYLYADASGLTDNSEQLAKDLLDVVKVAVTPGKDFGDNQPERYLRFAYTTDIAFLEEGVKRMAAFLR